MSDRWIAKSKNRLRKRFLMITEHKESVGRQWKTDTHEMNGECKTPQQSNWAA